MFRPFLNARVRLRTAAGLRADKGVGFLSSIRLAESVDDKDIYDGMTQLAAEQGVQIPDNFKDPSPGTMGAIGDGAIIQAIIDFFNSPTGQALLDALVKLLIGLLIGG